MKQDCAKYDGCRKPVPQCNSRCAEYFPRCIHYGDCPFNDVWDCQEDDPHATCKHRVARDAERLQVPPARDIWDDSLINEQRQPDTNELLDRCSCTSRACFVYGDGGEISAVECMDKCGEGIVGNDVTDLMVSWNRLMRDEQCKKIKINANND